HLVRQLASADIEGVEQIIDELATCRPWADPKLRALVAESSPPKDAKERKERLHASLALLPVDPAQVAYLKERLLDENVGPAEALVIARRLGETDHHRDVVSWLRDLLETEHDRDRRFRAACALARLDPGNDWNQWSKEVAEELVKKDLDTAKKWTLLLRGVRSLILRSVEQVVLLDPGRPESERSLAAVLMMDILIGGFEIPTKRQLHNTLKVEGAPYQTLSELFTAGGQEGAALVHGELNKLRPAKTETLDDLARRQAHAAVLLLQMEEWYSRRGP